MYDLYPMLRDTHITTVAITSLLFVLRWIWSVRDSPHLRRPSVRVLPHVNDTLLLLSGLGMALLLHQYPLVQPWLTAKLLALICYILLGGIAIRYGRTPRQRLWAGVAALTVLGYLIGVGIHRSPLSWLATWGLAHPKI
jgi:uncharacterized membrane protein SirB2